MLLRNQTIISLNTYEMGADTAEDIALPTGISRSEVTSKLQNYEKQGLVEVIVNL